jgi:type IV pilus assembly protein PilW
MPYSKLRNVTGFTLTELIVAMGISMVALAAVTTTFMAQAKFYNAQEQINEMQQNVRGALDVIMRELKMAGYKPNGGTFDGVPYSASQLAIQADLDSSGTISNSSTADEQITYAYDSANKQITRKKGTGTAEALADNITAFAFSYYDGNGAATTTPANIRQVKVDITARTAKPDPNYTSNNGYRTYQLTATITPPNLGL